MSGRSRRALIALAASSGLLAGVSGCGSTGATDVRRVVMVTPGPSNDVDWTIGAREAFEAVVDGGHLRGAIVDGSASARVTPLLDQASRRAQLVIAHESSYARAAAAAAVRTGVAELVWGHAALRAPDRVADLEVAGAEPGYLAGVIAAKASSTRRLGVVVCDDGSPWASKLWNEIAGGFVAGARSTPGGVRIAYTRVEARGAGAPRAAAAATRRMLRAGTQTVLGLCGRGGAAVLHEVARAAHEHQFVGALGDKAILGLERWLVVAIRWDVAPALRRAIADLRDGAFGDHSYTLSLENGGLELLRTGRTPIDAYEAADAARQQIDAGAVAVPRIHTAIELRKLVHEAS